MDPFMEKWTHLSPFSLRYWQQTALQAWHRFNRQGRALILLRKAQEHMRRGRVPQAILYTFACGMIAPEVAFYTVFYPRMRDFAKRVLLMTLERRKKMQGIPPETEAYLDYTDPWSDGWVGPRLVISTEAGMEAHAFLIQGWAHLDPGKKPLVLSVSVDGQTIGKKRIAKGGNFTLKFSLPEPLIRGLHTVEVKSTTWFVPHSLERNEDYRPLSFRIKKVGFR